MNDFDKNEGRKIRKRIEIKQNNLKILLPEINYLRFIEELEQFQQIIEGVESDNPSPQVQLPLARSRFESLQDSHKQLVSILEENIKRIDKHSSETLLTQFFEAIHESKLYVIKCFRNFCAQILTSTNSIYNIRAILKIYDLLYDLKEDVNGVKQNFYNYKKSTRRRQVKEVLAHIYTGALASTNLKFESLARLFPRVSRLPIHQLRFKIYKSKMADTEPKPELNALGTAEPLPENPEDEGNLENIDGLQAVLSKHQSLEIVIVNSEHGRRSQGGQEDAKNVEAAKEEGITEKDDELNKEMVEEEQLNINLQDGAQAVNNDVETTKEQEKKDEDEFEVEKGDIEINEEKQRAEKEADDKDGTHDTDLIDTKINEAETAIRKGIIEADVVTDADSKTARQDSVQITDKTSIHHLLQHSIEEITGSLKNDLDEKKMKMNRILAEMHNFENQMKSINKQLATHRQSFKITMDELDKRKRAITDSTDINEDERAKALQDIAVEVGQLTGVNEERVGHLELEKGDLRNLSIAQAKKFKKILTTIHFEEQNKVSKLLNAMDEATEEEKEKIQITIDAINQVYEEGLKSFEMDEENDDFQVDDIGVFYMDSSNKKRYLNSVGEARTIEVKPVDSVERISERPPTEKSSSKSTSTVCESVETEKFVSEESTTSSSDISKEQEQLPMDSENYIKSTLGKPLRQALAAITLYQPSDPINYLANYLLQYRYNELRNIQRQQDFENLVLQRERYAQRVQLENMLNERQLNNCDACFLPPTDRI